MCRDNSPRFGQNAPPHRVLILGESRSPVAQGGRNASLPPANADSSVVVVRTIAFDGLAEADAGDGGLSRRLCVMTRHLGGRVQRAGELMGEGATASTLCPQFGN